MSEHKAVDQGEKRKAWGRGNALVAEVLDLSEAKSGMQKKIEKNMGAVLKTTNRAPNAITCIDDRAAPGVKRFEKKTCVGCAGCGILIKGVREYLTQGAGLSEEMKTFVAELKNKKIKYVYPHTECGAAQAFANSVGETDKGSFYGKLWAFKLADLIGGEMRKVVPVKPKGFHDARALYLDLTPDGRFNPDEATAVFPKGFHISADYLGKNQATTEVGIGIDIALSDGGFGDLFTKESPFVVFVAGYEMDGITKMSNTLISLFYQKYKGRVVFRSAVLPSVEK